VLAGLAAEGATTVSGLGHLERTVLAVLRCLGHEPPNLNDLLGVICPDCRGRLLDYPWYRSLAEHGLPAGRADVRIASQVLANDLQDSGVRLARVHSYCLDVAHYNLMVSHVRNKSNILFTAATRLVQQVSTAFPVEDVLVLIDRQGGRMRYREHLMRSFPGPDLRVVQENRQRSVYEMRERRRMRRLSFEVAADAHHLPVALASMVSKYVRESLMTCLNRYFVNMAKDLKPTAGYWQDGLRFVGDLRTRLPHVEIDNERLIRCR
jgi:hypothetical protein